MRSWLSHRFDRTVQLTHHALQRMAQRDLGQPLVADLIETGRIHARDPEYWWIYKQVEGRDDNLVCAAVVSRQAMIVKTLMAHWELDDL
jgi:hypothetical protein